MACCSEFQTECLKVITVGHLKNFVGSEIQDSSNGSSKIPSHSLGDTYCPTYDELTGGTLVQNWEAGTTPYTDTDGIIISGSYRGDQLVRQEDLSLKYTRFNTLSISRSGSGNMSECGGNATLQYTYNYKTYTKSMNSSCSVSSSDETLSSNCSELVYHLTYGGLQNSGSSITNCTQYHINKNGAVSAASRTDSIYCGVTFRGTYHKSNTITITQNALTGSYSVFDRNIPTGCTATATTKTSFGCEGGSYGASGTGWYNVQSHWKEINCNVEYPSLTAITSQNNSVSLGSKSGSFSEIKCPTTDCTDSSSLSFSYGGYSASVSFTQSGTKSCEACNDYNTYGSCSAVENVDACATAVTVGCYVDTTIHHKEWVDGVCTETGTSAGEQDYQSALVIISENTSQVSTSYTGSITSSKGGTINYTINQAAGPCGGCGGETATTVWDNQTVTADCCVTSVSVTLTGTKTIKYDNCEDKTEPVTSGVTCNIEKNMTSSPTSYTRTFGDVTVTINQIAGPCPCTETGIAFVYDDIVLSCKAAEETTINTGYTKYTYYSDCETKSERGTNQVNIPRVDCYSGSTPNVIQAGSSGTTLNAASPKITQTGSSDCCCECKITASGGATISKDGGNNLTLGTYSATSCVTNIGATSSDSWIGITSVNGGQIRGNVALNPDTTDRTATITVTGKSGSVTCSSGFTVTQQKKVCTPTTAYTYAPKTIDCNSHSHAILQYTATTTAADCTTASTTGEIDYRYNFPENCNGDEYIIYPHSPSYSASVVQEPCECGCSPGTDNVYGSPINLGPDAGSHEDDSYVCGWDGNVTSFRYVEGDADFVSATFSSNHVSYTTTSSNDGTTQRHAVYEITRGNTGYTGTCSQRICNTWKVDFYQDPRTCGCEDLDWKGSGLPNPSATDTSYLFGSYAYNCFKNGTYYIISGGDWITVSFVIDASAGRVYCYAHFNANTTGEPRSAIIRLEISTNGGSVCLQSPEITQEG